MENKYLAQITYLRLIITANFYINCDTYNKNELQYFYRLNCENNMTYESFRLLKQIT